MNIRFDNYTFKHTADECPFVGADSFIEHYHTSYELLYFLHGDADYVIESELYKLRPHNLLVIKPGQHHHLIINSTGRYERMVIRFDETALAPELREPLRNSSNVYYIHNTRLSEELLRLDRFDKLPLPDNSLQPIVYQSVLNILLVYLLYDDTIKQTADTVDERVASITDYIRSNLTNISTLDNICRALHLSRSSVSQAFLSSIHVPIMSYIRTQKCMLAHSLLLQGLPSSTVYLQCGFKTYSSFYRTYCKVFQHPPSETGTHYSPAKGYK